jgi:hypothetical protein
MRFLEDGRLSIDNSLCKQSTPARPPRFFDSWMEKDDKILAYAAPCKSARMHFSPFGPRPRRCCNQGTGKAVFARMLALAGFLLAASPAGALELHSFVDDRCQVRTGMLVRVDEMQVHFITLEGAYATLPVEAVGMVVIHKVLENPLSLIAASDPLRALARHVRTGQDDASVFVGWPVGFYDQLIIFFDTEGRSHVLEPQDIRSIKPAQGMAADIRPAAFAKVALDFPPELLLCGLPRSEAGLRPSRVLGDRIKVDDYLAKLRDRYIGLDSFEERTRVYPRPLVFDPMMRLGLAYFSGKRGELVKYLPIYFQWSSGRPYRFQSKSAIGVVASPWLPIVEPTFGFQSDVKSHFFTASFVGHLISLPAGNAAFKEEVALFPQGTTPAVDELYNYLMLMGGDFGPFSLSGGALYRSVRVAFSDRDRYEITADAWSPVVRLMWIGAHLRLRAMYFRTRQDRSTGEGLRMINSNFSDESGDLAYDLHMDSLRAGVDLDLPMDLSVSADQILTVGSYRQASVASMDIVHALTSIVLTAQFSRYVATKGYFNLMHRRYDITRDAAGPSSIVPGAKNRTNVQLGGALEFLF